MTNGITVKRQFHVRRGGNRGQVRSSAKTIACCVPRISRLMALAIRFEQLIEDGVITDQAALARLGKVTRARLTQIMNLLNLVPEIQEEILSLSPVTSGTHPTTERGLRLLLSQPDWQTQRKLWRRLPNR